MTELLPDPNPEPRFVGEGVMPIQAFEGYHGWRLQLIFGLMFVFMAWRTFRDGFEGSWLLLIPPAIPLVVMIVLAVRMVRVRTWHRKAAGEDGAGLWTRFEIGDGGLTQRPKSPTPEAPGKSFDWFMFGSFVKTPTRLILYMRTIAPSGANAVLVPASFFGDQYVDVVRFIAQHVKEHPKPEPRKTEWTKTLLLWLLLVALFVVIYYLLTPR